MVSESLHREPSCAQPGWGWRLWFSLCWSICSCGWMIGVVSAADGQLPAETQRIDSHFQQRWQEYGLRPSPHEADAKWLRRLFLDLVGRIPTLAETQEYLADRRADKRRQWVDRLLYDDRYLEAYANHWGTIWSNLLIGRSGGTENNSLISRAGMGKYLRDSFALNQPYDVMVYELITATGTTSPESPDFNGATNFLVDKVNQDEAVAATAAVSRIFLGLQVQCTQCHDHPFNSWKQRKFWEFNAFFRQTRALRRFSSGSRQIDHAALIDQDFSGQSGRPQEAEIYYQLRNGLTKVAYPTFVDGQGIATSGYVAEVNRRQELGRLVLASEYLDQMLVNRMWGHFLGYGFTQPVDDMGPQNPPSDPELLEYLAERFRASSYDLKQLMRSIVLSEPYRLSSRSGRDNARDDPQLGERPRFSRFYSRQMSPEQLYQSLMVLNPEAASGTLEQQQQQRERWLRQFVIAFGSDDGGEATTFNGSITQSLTMFNGELMRRATATEPGNFLHRLVYSPVSYPDKVHLAFLAGLGRRAERAELAAAQQLLMARGGQPKEALEDLWWAILNSNEFIINH